MIGFALLLCSLSPTFVRAAGLGEPCEDAEDCAHSGLICNHRQMVCEFCTTDAQCADHGAFICGEQGDGEHEESEPGFDGEKGARHCARVTLEPQSAVFRSELDVAVAFVRRFPSGRYVRLCSCLHWWRAGGWRRPRWRRHVRSLLHFGCASENPRGHPSITGGTSPLSQTANRPVRATAVMGDRRLSLAAGASTS